MRLTNRRIVWYLIYKYPLSWNSNSKLTTHIHKSQRTHSWVLWMWFSVPMASSKLVIFSVLLALIFSQIRADVSVQEDEPLKVIRSDSPDSSALKIELDQLKAKIHSLGSYFSYFTTLGFLWTQNSYSIASVRFSSLLYRY